MSEQIVYALGILISFPIRNKSSPAKKGNIMRTKAIQNVSYPQPVATSPCHTEVLISAIALMITKIHSAVLPNFLPNNA